MGLLLERIFHLCETEGLINRILQLVEKMYNRIKHFTKTIYAFPIDSH